MARSNESAIQRLQVGLVGLIVVLLFVSIASMILDGADDPQQTEAEATAKADGAPTGKGANEEPLVELGVTPVVPDQPEKQTSVQPAPGTPQN
jgi:hypothetical protein